MLAYVFAPSARHLLGLLDQALQRGVRLTLVVNVIPDEPVALSAELRNLASRFPRATVRFFRDPDGAQLHAKMLVVDRAKAIVGSANLTWSGFSKNHEIGLMVEGAVAWELALLADTIAKSQHARLDP